MQLFLNQLLQSGTTSPLLKRAALLTELTRLLRGQLDAEFGNHLQVSAWDGETLTVHADSAGHST